ncbi:helix-turn-helix transcriptional regulator [Kribbella sp. NPDC059898]|uniref:helix-turn-helix transcriptional regulator n=1 Tax=Kribbella sp. NPDC059898 TaxID=3346995 RepID=UPI003648698B
MRNGSSTGWPQRFREAMASAGLRIEDVAARIGVDPKTVERWCRGKTLPYPRHRTALAGLLRVPEESIWPAEELKPKQSASSPVNLVVAGSPLPGGFNDPRQVTNAAAEASFEFLTWAEDTLPAAVLDHVMSELQRLAVAYVHAPVRPIFDDLVQLRDATFGLLKNRPHPRQSRTLFFTAGTVCTLLAHASQNLGNSSAARTQAAAAWACADQADHAGLRSWVRGTQALIAEWTDNYNEAVSFARDGQRYALGEQMVRLAAIEGRSLARIGDAEGAVHAVVRAARARDTAGDPDEVGELGGILTFPAAKQLYYAGSTLSLVGRHADAEKAAREAISLYETGSPAERSYGDEALARVDVAAARLADDDLDGMRESLAPVLALPIAQRIRQISDGLSRVQRTLVLPRYRRAASTIELTEHIAGFSAPEGLPRLG